MKVNVKNLKGEEFEINTEPSYWATLEKILQGLEENDEGDEVIDEFEDFEKSDSMNAEIEEKAFTTEEENSIKRIMVRGFSREEVIAAEIACDKNEESTANMLFSQQDEGDFEQNQ